MRITRKLTPTLTQSGLLAVLLQRQRYKVIQLAQRRARRRYNARRPLEYPHLAVPRAHGVNAHRRFCRAFVYRTEAIDEPTLESLGVS
jgi:hypothetical protein